MSILQEVTASIGDKHAQNEILKQCLERPVLLHTVAEGLRSGSADVQFACMDLLLLFGKRRPELLGNFVVDLQDALRGKSKRVAKAAANALILIAPFQSSELFAMRDELFQIAERGGPLGLSAAKILAALGGHSPNYRGKLTAPLVRLLEKFADAELHRWISAIAPAIAGSPEGYARLARQVSPRIELLDNDAVKVRIEKQLKKLEKSTSSKRR